MVPFLMLILQVLLVCLLILPSSELADVTIHDSPSNHDLSSTQPIAPNCESNAPRTEHIFPLHNGPSNDCSQIAQSLSNTHVFTEHNHDPVSISHNLVELFPSNKTHTIEHTSLRHSTRASHPPSYLAYFH